MTAYTSLMLGPLEIPFTLSDEDKAACGGLIDAQCPVFQGEPIRYGLGMTVNTPILGVTVDIKFALKDDTGKEAVCYKYSQTITE